ncbi:MAG: ribonuclease R [Lachnospiraceae bacterium]|nr:ribonuclease R [Lachnospiraceae bacterium]
MEEITTRKNKILELMKEPSYVPMKEKELAILMQVNPEDRPVFKACLDELLKGGLISVSKRGKYMLPEAKTLTGVFSSSGHGYGFVHVDGIEDDFFISEKNTGTALHGDTVRIDPYEVPFRGKRRNAGKSREAVVVEVTERETDLIVGTYDAAKNHYGFVIPDSTRIDRDIFVPLEYSMNAVDGHKVVVRITDFGDRYRNPEGRIIEILGHSDDPGIDILSILKAYGVEPEFPDKVLNQAQKVPQELRATDYRGREDIRSLDMVTIDGPDSKDLDDAVSLTIDGDDYILGVHIADVTHYVKEGSAIDREALERGTSCYPVDRVVPMLPQQLCNGICSLNENVDRLAVSCFMTIDKKGVIKDNRFALTVINTNHRMIYGDVDKIITDHNESLMEKFADVSDMLIRMHELALLLRHRRKSRGSIDFDLPETEMELDDNGHPIAIYPHERNNATKLIEDFMLAANETVAEHFFWAQAPFVYRIHEKPDMDKIRKLATFIRNFGYGIKIKGDELHPKELQKLLSGIEDTPEEALISRLTLRSMQQAKYSTDCSGHFGLALKYYCHFTSPIRRYPDLQIHRIIKDSLRGKLDEDRMEHYRNILGEVCRRSSSRERIAVDVEREVDKLKKAEYMQDHIGEVFEGVISGITNWGIYVELPNTVEGLVHISKIEGDYYTYNEETYELVGRGTGRRFCLGTRIRVVCNMVDIGTRTVDFILDPIEDRVAGAAFERVR